MQAGCKVLEFPNHLLQLQWVAAALSRVEAEAKKSRTPLDIKHPLVSPLLAGLLSPSLPTTHACCSALVAAASCSWVARHATITALVSQAASMTAYPLAVGAIGELLLCEVKDSTVPHGKYNCPYSLRTNIHPFVSVLNSRPESGQCIVSEITQMLTAADTSCVLELLKPFVAYVLLSPTASPDLLLVGKCLHSELLSVAGCLHKQDLGVAGPCGPGLSIVEVLVRMVPLQPSQSDQQLLTVVSMVEALVHWLCQFQDTLETIGPLFHSLLDSCLSLCCELTVRALHLLPLLHCVDAILTAGVGFLQYHVLCIGWLLLRNLLNPLVAGKLLSICRRLCSNPLPSLSLLAFPLVQLLSQPIVQSLPSHNFLSTNNQKMAATLLQLVEQQVEQESGATGGERHQLQSIKVDHLVLVQKLQAPTNIHSCSKWYSIIVSAAHTYATRLHSPPKIVSWLRELVGQWGDSTPLTPGSLDYMAPLLAALTLRHCDNELLPSLLKAFGALAKAEPTLSPSLLPFLLHLQSRHSSPDSKLAILYSIPTLATHKLATVGVVNTLQMLGGSPSLIAMVTRLIGKVWQRQDHIFPRVRDFLLRSPPSSISPIIARELELARAAVIRDICCLRPEQHGEEMLSLVSGVLSKSHDPILVAMAIEGLVSLCRAEVVDVATLWGVLGTKLSTDNRLVVVTSLCTLFELAAHLDSERHSNKIFRTVALKSLWENLFSKSEHICSAVLRALSSFQLEDFTADFLPPEVAIQLGLTSHDQSHDQSHDPEAIIPLVGCHCVQLLHYIPDGSLSDFALFLAGLLNEELSEVPRGVVYTALRQAEVPTRLERIVSSIPEKLCSMCTTHCSRDTAAGVIRDTLMSVYEAPSPTASRVQGRQVVTERVQRYSAMLESFLGEGGMRVEPSGAGTSGDCVYLMYLSSADQWSRFMARLRDAYCKVRLLDTCPLFVREESDDDHVLVQKKIEALEWTRSQVADKLLQYLRSNVDAAPSVLLALVGMASIPDVIGQKTSHVTSTHQSGEWSQETLLMELMECMTVILHGTQPNSDHSVLTNLVQILQQSQHSQLKTTATFALPALVEGVLTHWKVLPAAVSLKLVALTSALSDDFNRAPQWYTAVVLSQLMSATLPVCPQMDPVFSTVTPYIKASIESDNLELLSLMAAFLPLLPRTQQIARQFIVVVHSTLTSLPPSLLPGVSTQLLCLHVANGISVLFTSGVFSADEAMGYVRLLADLATKAPLVSGFYLSLAVSLSGLAAAGHHGAASLADAVAAKWVQEADRGEPTLVVPVIWGLAGLLGVNPVSQLSWNWRGSMQVKFLEALFPLVVSTLEKLAAHPDNTVCACSLWLMGQVQHSVSHVLTQQEKVPPNYGYLPDTSILSSTYSLLESLSRHVGGEESKAAGCILQVLAASGHPLPPVDLTSCLIPLCRNRELQLGCVQCLVSSRGTRGLQAFATHCCSPLVFGSLQLESQCLLAENLSVLRTCLRPSRLALFLQLLGNTPLQQPKLLQSFTSGLKCALREEDCSESKSHLATIVAELYTRLSEDGAMVSGCGEEIAQNLAACLRLADNWREVMERPLLSAQCLRCIMHCCWVTSGEESFTTLRPLTEWILNNAEHQLVGHVFLWLADTVSHCCSPQQAQNTLLHQTDLLHCLVTWTRTNTPSPQQMRMVLLLTAVAMVSSNHDQPLSSFREEKETSIQDFLSGVQLLEPPTSPVVREKLCQCLLEWFGTADTEVRQMITRSFSVLKSCKEYQKAPIWTSVAHVLLQQS